MNKLQARVEAVNKANTLANEVYAKLTAFFAAYVGQKIFNADGSMVKKIRDKMPTFPDNRSLNVTAAHSRYNIAYTVNACESYEERGNTFGMYHHTITYIGDLDNSNILKAISQNGGNFRTDYTVEDVAAKREAYKVAKAAADKAQSDLFPFGEIDN